MFMTEEQIEQRVEHMIDAVDRLFMAGRIDQKTYDLEMHRINTWAEREYFTVRSV